MAKRMSIPKKGKSLLAFFDDTFGLKSHFLRALFVLWITTSLSLIVLNLIGRKQSSVIQIFSYILLTFIVVLASSFSATCFRYGDCPIAAYFSATLGILIISGSALNFN